MNGNDIPDAEGPDAEGPDAGGPEAEGPEANGPIKAEADKAASAEMAAKSDVLFLGLDARTQISPELATSATFAAASLSPSGVVVAPATPAQATPAQAMPDQPFAAPLLPDLLHPIGNQIANFVRKLIAFSSLRAGLVTAAIILLAIMSGLFTYWRVTPGVFESPTQFAVHSSRHDARQAPISGAPVRSGPATPSLSLFDDSALFLTVHADQSDVSDAFVAAVVDRLTGSAPDQGAGTIAGLFAYHLDPFFQRNGLVFQPIAGLESTLADISQTAPFIRKLRKEKNVDFFFEKLAETAEDFDTASLASENTNALLLASSDFVEGELRGQRQPFAWNDLLWHRDKWQARSQFLAVWPLAQDKASVLRTKQTIDDAVDAVRADTRFAGVTTEILNPKLRSYASDAVFWRALAFWAGLAGLGLILWTVFVLRQVNDLLILLILSLVTISLSLGIAGLIFGGPNLISWLVAPGLLAIMIPLWSVGLISLRRGASAAGSEREARQAAFGDMVLRDGRFILGYGSLAILVTLILALLARDALRIWAGTLALGMLVALPVGLVLGAALFALRDWHAKDEEPEAGLQDDIPAAHPSRNRAPGAWNHDLRRRLGFPLLGLALLGFAAIPWIRFNRENLLNVSTPVTPIVDASEPGGLPFLNFPDPRLSGIGLEIRATSEKKAREIVNTLEKQSEIRSIFWAGDFVPEQITEKLELIDATAQGMVSAASSAAGTPDLAAGHSVTAPAEGSGNGLAEDDRQPDSGLRFLRDSLLSVASDGANQLRTSLDRYVSARNADPQLEDHVWQDLFTFWPAHRLRLANWLKPDPQIRFQDLPIILQKNLIGLDPGTGTPFWRIHVYPRANMDVRRDRDAFLKTILASYPQARGPLLDTRRANQCARERLGWWIGLVLMGLVGAGMLLGRKVGSIAAHLAAGLVWTGLVAGVVWLLRVPVDPWLEAFIILSGLSWISASGVAIWRERGASESDPLTPPRSSRYGTRAQVLGLSAPILLSLLWGGWVIAPLDALSQLGLIAMFVGPLAVLSLWVVIPQIDRLLAPRPLPIEL